jgi:hypothetical protein
MKMKTIWCGPVEDKYLEDMTKDELIQLVEDLADKLQQHRRAFVRDSIARVEAWEARR